MRKFNHAKFDKLVAWWEGNSCFVDCEHSGGVHLPSLSSGGWWCDRDRNRVGAQHGNMPCFEWWIDMIILIACTYVHTYLQRDALYGKQSIHNNTEYTA